MRELIIDCFAGGGGTSQGIEDAGFIIDHAINHDPDAIEMHLANHPGTQHWCENIWKIKPLEVTKGQPVGLAWFSPDCTHFSRAKGGKPVKKQIRGLAWIVVRWASLVKPRIIILENVSEFQTWGPLREDNKPCPKRKGKTFNLWLNRLRGLGYKVEWRELSAADYGAPTIRKRLFLIARCDGQPIVWPQPTHGSAGELLGLKPYRTAAECIDWSIPCPSIFERKRPLAEHTLRRIAKGIRKFIIEAKEPFIIRTGHYSNITGKGDTFRGQGLNKPLGTICSINDKAIVMPSLIKYHGQKANETRGQRVDEPIRTLDTQNRFGLVLVQLVGIDHKSSNSKCSYGVDKPLNTITKENRFAFVTAFLSKYYTGVVGSDLRKPTPTVTAIDHNAIVTSHLTKFYSTNIGSDMRQLVPTITGQGQHIGEVRAFLIKYYNTNIGSSLKSPMHTITSKDHFGLVTVVGEQYQIADIGLRMLSPRELAWAQGFPDSYVLTGSKSNQVAKIGNSVCPPMAKALVKANFKQKELAEKVVAGGQLRIF